MEIDCAYEFNKRDQKVVILFLPHANNSTEEIAWGIELSFSTVDEKRQRSSCLSMTHNASPFDYFLWGVVEQRVNKSRHLNLESLKASVT